jgi:maltose phosphorylase
MKNHLVKDNWKVIEDKFNPSLNRVSESVFSLGNGRMGLRGNFEEQYSGDSLQGTYVAGVYYPDKTKVGWWKNGYPEYFAKVLNAVNWIGINIWVYGEALDLAECEIKEFKRTLHMKEGYLERSFVAKMKSGNKVEVNVKRFCSIVDDELGAIRYSIKPLNFDGQFTFSPYLDFDVKNEDSNYQEKFWEEVNKEATEKWAHVTASTKKTDFHVCAGMRVELEVDGKKQKSEGNPYNREKFVSQSIKAESQKGEEIVIYKYVGITSSLNHSKKDLVKATQKVVKEAKKKGFDQLLEEHTKAWEKKWIDSDIVIEGDVSAQQGIRFNIFQLNQTYTGEDSRLNIGPKGFTGEKYGGVTYWDTEAYCIPFYLSTSSPEVAKNLLIYRYNHLQKAIENAEKLGFSDGAALYPMVTINGEECHNEWEITFEEIHRNGAIAYAIFDYIRYTNDREYLAEYGLEVLIAISRFWAQRVNYSEQKKKYVILGVTGPNEYENNVNNNWYTNTIAAWVMNYTLESIKHVKDTSFDAYKKLMQKIQFDDRGEAEKWKHICENMFYPEDKKLGIFLQQDNYLDKEQIMVKDLDSKHLPLVHNWSWDRILRSCFIKQADVLQGMYFFEDDFDKETVERNFKFYEPRTVHESSLSPCVHSVLAAKLGMEKKAYEMYIQTSRLDLDDLNSDSEDGLHITSMAGTWMSVVKGFGGFRVKDGQIQLQPMIPTQWNAYTFTIKFREALVRVRVSKAEVKIQNDSDENVEVIVFGETKSIKANSTRKVRFPNAKKELTTA